jgi:hypothetical protein
VVQETLDIDSPKQADGPEIEPITAMPVNRPRLGMIASIELTSSNGSSNQISAGVGNQNSKAPAASIEDKIPKSGAEFGSSLDG